jgi:BR serine/threonine kinase
MQPAVQVGDYVLQGTLGVGSTGKVKLAEHKMTGQKVAIKIIKKATIEDQPDLAVKIRREISLMKLLDHPHILRLIEVHESCRHLYIILEYIEHGELFDYLTSYGYLKVEESLRFFRQMILALEYLHHHGICHRDLKPENILLDDSNNIRIADFGFARWMRHATADTSCGSPHYAAPEIVKGETYDGRKSDIWSAGVVLYTLLSGKLPFDDTSIRALLQKVKVGQYRMPDFPADIKHLIGRMLEVDPKKRVTIAEIKQTPAFQRDMPPDYIFPVPLPIPLLVDPVDPDSLDETTIDTLHQLGYESDRELRYDLRSKEHKMAKVFVAILTNRLSFDHLPWNTAEANDPDGSPGSPIFFSPDADGLNNWSGRSDSGPLSGGSYGGSVTEPLFTAGEPTPPSTSQEIDSTAEVEWIMGALQPYLSREGFAWFHPHSFKIIARRLADPLMDIEILAIIDPETRMFRIRVSLIQGDMMEFGEFVQRIEACIAGIPM